MNLLRAPKLLVQYVNGKANQKKLRAPNRSEVESCDFYLLVNISNENYQISHGKAPSPSTSRVTETVQKRSQRSWFQDHQG